MSDNSAIEWTDATWNPVRGCKEISPGCARCYAKLFAERFRGVKGHPYEQGFDLRLVPDKLMDPLKWRNARRIFVDSMSDLFQAGVPTQYITDAFGVMLLAHWHTHYVLTKRHERMLEYVAEGDHGIVAQMAALMASGGVSAGEVFRALDIKRRDNVSLAWPPPNVRLGVSVENQAFADRRFPAITEIARLGWKTMVSLEPLLGPVRIPAAYLELGKRGWVIVGGESGRNPRPCAIEWIEHIVAQCLEAGVPVFVKQLGAFVVSEQRTIPLDDLKLIHLHLKPRGKKQILLAPSGEAWAWRAGLSSTKGGAIEDMPEHLRIRQFPEAA